MRSKFHSVPGLLFLLMLLLASLPPAMAQAQTLVALGNAAVELTGPWKFHTDDDMRWAAPDFDDSAWGTMDLTPPSGSIDPVSGDRGFVPGWAARGYPGYHGYAWYRLRVNVAIHEESRVRGHAVGLAIKMPEDVDDAYQVYVNGQLIGHFGQFRPHDVAIYPTRPLAFSLPRDIHGGPLTIAIRMWAGYSAPEHVRDYGGLHGPPILGLASVVNALLALNQDALSRSRASNSVEIVVDLLALLIVLGLFWLDRSEPAYPWLAFSCAISLAFCILISIADGTTWIRAAITDFVLFVVLLMGQMGVWIHFWGAWFRLGRTRQTAWLYSAIWAVVILLAAATTATLPPFYGRSVPLDASGWLLPLAYLLRLLVAAILLWVAALGIRKDRAEGLLALPALVLLAIAYTPDLSPHSFSLGRRWWIFGTPIPVGRIATFTCLAIITVLMLRRFLRAQRQREQMRQEFEQARHVQQLLVPAAPPETPGYAVESVYLPASQVGGDFFQVLPAEDGSLLVLVGDVSGKGLSAAMTVSTIVGALRGCRSRRPAEVLAYLNGVLQGEITGFVTCCAALISSDGELTLANAGHLPPYLNGEEMAVAGGLPLGIVAAAAWEEASFQLAPGDRLTLVSDGVVEATNEKRELFGFERTERLSRQPAEAIAEAARRFGQRDDITVISVERAPSPALTPA